MTKTQIESMLKENGLLITENRMKIISCLSDGQHFHAISDISQHVEGLNTKSVYNNIKTLIEKGIVDSYSFGGVSKYALNDNLHHNDTIHIVESNNQVAHIEVDPKIFKKIEKAVQDTGRVVKKIKIYVDIK